MTLKGAIVIDWWLPGCIQEEISIIRQNFNQNFRNPSPSPKLFYHLPGFYLKSGFLNIHPLSLGCISFLLKPSIHKAKGG